MRHGDQRLPARVAFVGAGQGLQRTAALRQEGFDGAITLVGHEPGVPYPRPPRSKARPEPLRAARSALS